MGYKLNKTEWLLGLVLAAFVVFDGYLAWRWYRVSGGRRGEVRLDSEVAGYRLEAGSEDDFDNLLVEVGFWDGRAVVDLLRPGRMVSAKGLEILLVPRVDRAWWRQVTEEGEMVAEVGMRFAGKGRPVIEMAMTDTILENEEKRNRRANSLLLYGLHGLVARLAAEGDVKGNSGRRLSTPCSKNP